jgi:copper transport protein
MDTEPAEELVMAGGPLRSSKGSSKGPSKGPSKGSSRSARRSGRAGQERELLARKRLRLSVWTEVGIGVAVLAITSLLVATPPGSRPAAADSAAPLPEATPTSQPEVVSREISLDGGGRVYVQLQPARVGEATLVIAVLDSANKPWDVPEVTAALSFAAKGIGPLPVTLRKVRPGDYTSTGLSVPLAGTWQLQITVRTTEIDQFTVDTTLQVY